MAAISLADLLPPAPAPGRRRLGLEMHVRVVEDGRALESAQLLSRLASVSEAVDPRDASSRLLACGVLVSPSRRGAKLSLPPVDLRAGAPESLVSLARRAREEFTEWVRHDATLQVTPARIQISVSAGDELLPAVAGEFIRRCGLSTALLLGIDEEGLQVRPRRDRLEICALPAEDERLAAAMTFISASAMLIEDARWMAEALPKEVLLTIEPASLRYGSNMGPKAFGTDLTLFGRETPVILGGETVTAQQALEHVWEKARPWAERVGLDTSRVARLVAGQFPLAVEDPQAESRCEPRVKAPLPSVPDFGPLTTPRGARVSLRWLTWDISVWEIQDDAAQPALAVVPRDLVPDFLELAASPRMEDVIATYRRRGGRRQRMVDLAQVVEPALWDDVNPAALLPLERNGIGQVPLSARSAPVRGPQVPRPHVGGVRRRGSRGHLSAQPGH